MQSRCLFMKKLLQSLQECFGACAAENQMYKPKIHVLCALWLKPHVEILGVLTKTCQHGSKSLLLAHQITVLHVSLLK